MKAIIPSLILCVILVSYTPSVFAEFDALILLEPNSGNITFELFPDDAPKHVENFLKLTNSGFYDNTIFHRVIEGFMIQGGDPKTKPASPFSITPPEWGTGGPGTFVKAEFNTIKHDRGIVSMARSQDPDSAGSQFFIVHQDSNFLDQQYTVFGRIVTEESFTTLDKIANVETGDNDIPANIEDVRIIKASVVNRLQITDLMELSEPERIQSSTGIFPPSDQLFESERLGVKFTVPQGWLLQQPPKTTVDSPDVVATGPQTGTLPSAITLTITNTDGKTLAQLMDEKLAGLQPLIDEGSMEIKSQNASNVNGKDTNIFFIEAFFTTGTEKLNVMFMEASIYTPEKLYSFTLMNDDPAIFGEQINTLYDTIDSFEVISIPPLEMFGYTEEEREVYYADDMSKEEFLAMADERQKEYLEEQEGGCLIATAAYGSEMAPQVQFLREIRDNTVLQTQSGTAFMTGFNQFYYSFSPAVADYERENPMFKEAVKLSLTPMLTSLALLNYVDIDTEQEMLGYGIGVILLNIGMYFVAPAAVIIAIKSRIRNHTK